MQLTSINCLCRRLEIIVEAVKSTSPNVHWLASANCREAPLTAYLRIAAAAAPTVLLLRHRNLSAYWRRH